MVKITFVSPDRTARRTIDAPLGISLMKLAQYEGIDVEGACGGNLACSTCHMIFSDEDFDRLSPEMSEDEDILLDLASGVTSTSRLGCQIVVTNDMEGLTVYLPPETADMRG